MFLELYGSQVMNQSFFQIVPIPWLQFELGLSENRVPQKIHGSITFPIKRDIKWQSWVHSHLHVKIWASSSPGWTWYAKPSAPGLSTREWKSTRRSGVMVGAVTAPRALAFFAAHPKVGIGDCLPVPVCMSARCTFMWIKHCRKPPMTRNGNHPAYSWRCRGWFISVLTTLCSYCKRLPCRHMSYQ